MGFRTGAYATVWAIEPVSETNTKIRISINRKNKESGEYEQDFSGFVACIGTAAARKASLLKERDRIKLGDVDCSTFYNKEKGITYYNFKLFSFEVQEQKPQVDVTDPQPTVDEGEPPEEEDGLPF